MRYKRRKRRNPQAALPEAEISIQQLPPRRTRALPVASKQPPSRPLAIVDRKPLALRPPADEWLEELDENSAITYQVLFLNESSANMYDAYMLSNEMSINRLRQSHLSAAYALNIALLNENLFTESDIDLLQDREEELRFRLESQGFYPEEILLEV